VCLSVCLCARPLITRERVGLLSFRVASDASGKVKGTEIWGLWVEGQAGRQNRWYIYKAVRVYIYLSVFSLITREREKRLSANFQVALGCPGNISQCKNWGLMSRGQKISIFRFSMHQPVRHGRRWATLAYSLRQHKMQVGLTAGGVIHCGAGGQAAWQRACFDRAAG